MILSIHNTLLEDIQLAKKEGYVEDFMYADKKIVGRNNKKEYTAEQCRLVEYCRMMERVILMMRQFYF